MLVYADRSEFADPAERLDNVGADLGCVAECPAGIDRHAKLVGALIEAGQLLQGVADTELPGEESLNAFVYRVARCVIRSWDTGFAEIGELPNVPAFDAGGKVELRTPEGFAYYAVYPEAYIEAARQLRLSGRPVVIGIRSIGTSLGAIVAAALGAGSYTTVRPFGDPFARRVELPSKVMVDQRSHYVIVDEGPGLSGSSFGAVADWLEGHGVPLERIAFLPSHAGEPGPQSSEAHRRRWRRAQRIPADFGGRLPKLIRAWAGNRLGPLDQFKFAGLGPIGDRKFEMARTLHAARLTTEPQGLVHGFLIERSSEPATPLGPDEKPLIEIGRYIAARASLFPASERGGATIARLMEMCRRNISLGLGEEAARTVERWEAGALQRRVSRVRTDNRMDRVNWLRTSDGCLLKTDVLDHHCGHDLIGCQDMAWDVAGAIVEFGLRQADANELIASTEQPLGRIVDRELLDFYVIAYLAFRLGQSTLAGDGSAERCRSRLRLHLHQRDCRGTPQESLIG